MQFRLPVITTLLIINGASLLGSGEGGTRSDLTSGTAAGELTAEARANLLKRLHAKIDETKAAQAERSSRWRGKLKNVTIGKPKSGNG